MGIRLLTIVRLLLSHLFNRLFTNFRYLTKLMQHTGIVGGLNVALVEFLIGLTSVELI